MRVSLLRSLVRFSPLLPPAPSPMLPAGTAAHVFTQHPDQAYGDDRKGSPRFLLLDGFLGRTLIEQGRQAQQALPPSEGDLLASLQNPASDSLKGALERILREVKALRDAAETLRLDGTYRQGQAVTKDLDPPVLKATATDGADVPGGSITVLKLARSHEVASDPRPDAGAALGLRGSFTLGNETVQVLTTDKLQTIADRINHGEDANRNGKLDGAEDRNFNGALDPYEDANGTGRLDTGEQTGADLNYNGRVDADEDLNLNFKLDGGTARHGVEARVLEGRLILKRAEGGPEEIRVEDPDNLLSGLGFIQTNYQGDQVFSHVLEAPSGALVSRDGSRIPLDSNASSSLLDGMDLEFRREGGPVGVSVARDPSRAVDAVRTFVGEFNRVIGDLNALLDDGGVAAKEPRVQRFRRGLERAAEDPLAPPTPADGAGIQPRNLRDETFSEPQILGALSRLRQGLGGIFDHAHGIPSAAPHLNQLGITGLEDDTLALDEGALSEALGRDPGGVKRLLADPASGIAARVSAAVEAAAGAVGSLSRFRKSLGGVDLSPVAKGLQAFGRALQAGRESQLIAVA